MRRAFSTAAARQVDFAYEVLHQSTISGARVGRIHTPHGTIETPAFVGVGTNGCIKSLTMDQLKCTGLQLMFCNTLHLGLHPGAETVSALGGLHAYTGWDRPIITDSGGFQVFSLAYGSVE